MLNPFKRNQAHKPEIDAGPLTTRQDLQIRNLLDCPNLRHALGLDVDSELAERSVA